MNPTLFDISPLEASDLKLNDAQRRAITHGTGPLLVIAGAGTGKTRVITERIRHLLEGDPALGGENILALTYTPKAAGEMKSRIVKTCGERGRDVKIFTFHAFCEEILRENGAKYAVLEDVDHWILLRRNMARLKLEKFRRLAEPGQFLGDFLKFFSRCQDELVSSDDFQSFADELEADLLIDKKLVDEDTFAERAENVALQKEIARAYKVSEEILREKNFFSFGALITRTIELVRNDGALREKLQQRFKHILVDEFQDTNIAQLETPFSSSLSCATSSPSATTIKPSTVSAAHLSAASNFSSNASPAGRPVAIQHPIASRSPKTTARRPTSFAAATQVIAQNLKSALTSQQNSLAHASGRRAHPHRRTRE